MNRILLLFIAVAVHAGAAPETPQDIARQIIAPLIAPDKVDTLKGERPINTRTYRLLYWLEMARRAGGDVSGVVDAAQRTAGYAGTPRAKADAQAIIANRDRMEALGCFDAAGLAELRKGQSPTITKGMEAGRAVHLDHIIPIHIAPELAARFYDLAAISDRENEAKGAKITQRELDLARKWNNEGLLTEEGLAAVVKAAK